MFKKSKGASVTELGLVTGLIAIIIIGALSLSGSHLSSLFQQSANSLNSITTGEVKSPESTGCASGSQIITNSQQFEIDKSCTEYRVLLIGGGGGGTSGHQGGGGSGYLQSFTYSPADLSTSVSLVVGLGGAKDPGHTNNNARASKGENSCFASDCASGGDVVGNVNSGGQNGFSGGGAGGNSGSPGGSGGTCGSDGGTATGTSMPIGLGSGSFDFSIYKNATISCGTGGNGGTTSHAGGGGAGGILINSNGPTAEAGCMGCSISGCGGQGYGAGGGGGGYAGSNGCAARAAGGDGASGAIYIEWD